MKAAIYSTRLDAIHKGVIYLYIREGGREHFFYIIIIIIVTEGEVDDGTY